MRNEKAGLKATTAGAVTDMAGGAVAGGVRGGIIGTLGGIVAGAVGGFASSLANPMTWGLGLAGIAAIVVGSFFGTPEAPSAVTGILNAAGIGAMAIVPAIHTLVGIGTGLTVGATLGGGIGAVRGGLRKADKTIKHDQRIDLITRANEANTTPNLSHNDVAQMNFDSYMAGVQETEQRIYNQFQQMAQAQQLQQSATLHTPDMECRAQAQVVCEPKNKLDPKNFASKGANHAENAQISKAEAAAAVQSPA